jgi:hypothetical protein
LKDLTVVVEGGLYGVTNLCAENNFLTNSEYYIEKLIDRVHWIS